MSAICAYAFSLPSDIIGMVSTLMSSSSMRMRENPCPDENGTLVKYRPAYSVVPDASMKRTRSRIGIGKSLHGDTTNHVLGNIPPAEMEILPRVLDGGLEMLEMMLAEGLPKAMSLYNNKNYLDLVAG